MSTTSPPHPDPARRGAGSSGSRAPSSGPPAAGGQSGLAAAHGALLRHARLSRGLTLRAAGDLCGYSASTLSRIERGRQPLRDVAVIRRLCAALELPVDLFGLAAEPGVVPAAEQRVAHRVEPESDLDGGDPMRRREVLAGLVAVPFAASGRPPAATPASGGHVPGQPVERLVQALGEVLLRRPTGDVGAGGGRSEPLDEAGVARQLARCMRAFQASRYSELADTLPALVRQAEALPGDRATAAAVRAEVYNAVVRVFIKVETTGLGWVAADRALSAARASAEPTVGASCVRNASSLRRRDGDFATAQRLSLEAADELTVSGPQPDPTHLSMHGMLLLNAGYAAAQAGDRSRSVELLDLAETTARRLGADRNDRWTAFGPAQVTLHRISASFALGDAGTAISHARSVNPDDLRLPERRSRYWVDVARAYHQWGRFEPCYRALSIAEAEAPEEIRARPVVRRLAADLISGGHTSRLPGIREFATRVGAGV